MSVKRNGLLGLVVGGTLVLNGCIEKIAPQSIEGIPMSVGESYGQASGSFATVVTVDDTNVLGYVSHQGTKEIAEGMALIQSEIVDGDDEPIGMTGHYVGDRFFIHSIRANGYVVDFD